jgi:hypothetical protein
VRKEWPAVQQKVYQPSAFIILYNAVPEYHRREGWMRVQPIYKIKILS